MDATKLQLLNKTIAEEVMKWTHVEGNYYYDVNNSVQYLPPYSESLPHAMDLASRHNIGSIPDTVPGTYKAFEVATVTNLEATFVEGTVASSDTLPTALCLSVLKANAIDTIEFE